MTTRDRTVSTPLYGLFFKAPMTLDNHRLGRILGRRFVAVTPPGRQPGPSHRATLEVMELDPSGTELYVVPGFGEETDWLDHLRAAGRTELTISHRTVDATFRDVAADEAAGVFAHYEERHRFVAPVVRAVLSHLLGWRYAGAPSERARLARQLPMVALRPAEGLSPAA